MNIFLVGRAKIRVFLLTKGGIRMAKELYDLPNAIDKYRKIYEN
jgi:hypothetical protein